LQDIEAYINAYPDAKDGEKLRSLLPDLRAASRKLN
jgi:regulator of sirC expression with transglutaminase-like and TPR domain